MKHAIRITTERPAPAPTAGPVALPPTPLPEETAMTAPQTSPDAVLFLSAALQASGLPPSSRGRPGPLPSNAWPGACNRKDSCGCG